MKRLLPLFALVALIGCRSSQPGVGLAKPEPERKRIEVGKIDSDKFDEHNNRVWSLSLKHGGVDITGKEALGDFQEFSGALYRDGEKAALIRANAGSANSSTGIIECSKGAEFASELFDTSIKAERIEWRSKEDLIVAAGNVQIRHGKFALAAPGAVFADTAGQRVWINTKEESMKLRAAVLGLVGAAAVAAAPKDVIQYGTITLTGYDSFQVDLSQKDAIVVTCKGSKTVLDAPGQGLEIRSPSIQTTIVRDAKKKEYQIAGLTAEGGLRFKVNGIKVAGEASEGVSNVSGSAKEATYKKETNILRLAGEVVIIASHPMLEDPGVRNEGDEALIVLDPSTYRPVSFTLNSSGGVGRTVLTPKEKKGPQLKAR